VASTQKLLAASLILISTGLALASLPVVLLFVR